MWPTVESVLNATKDVHVIRDATRGGVGTVLYEIAGQSKVGIRLNAADVPVAPEVKGVCGMLGLEPLYLACEGRLVIMAPKSEAEKIVEVLIFKGCGNHRRSHGRTAGTCSDDNRDWYTGAVASAGW